MSERLQKFLARAGVASRRHAEGLITAGRVAVNNQVVTTLGTKVVPGDLVTVDGTLVSPPERSSWYLLHKPPGVVTTLSDPEGRPTVAGFLADVPGRVFPVGRLDWDAEGALLFTDDGGAAHRLLHPSFEVPRTYLVKVKGTPSDETLQRLMDGVRLEDGPAHALKARRHEAAERNTWIELQIGEGRPHLVKRLCAAVGHPVLRLFRPAQAGVSVAGLAPGQVRPLSPEEVRRVEGIAAGEPLPPVELFLPPRRHGRSGDDDVEAEPAWRSRPSAPSRAAASSVLAQLPAAPQARAGPGERAGPSSASGAQGRGAVPSGAADPRLEASSPEGPRRRAIPAAIAAREGLAGRARGRASGTALDGAADPRTAAPSLRRPRPTSARAERRQPLAAEAEERPAVRRPGSGGMQAASPEGAGRAAPGECRAGTTAGAPNAGPDPPGSAAHPTPERRGRAGRGTAETMARAPPGNPASSASAGGRARPGRGPRAPADAPLHPGSVGDPVGGSSASRARRHPGRSPARQPRDRTCRAVGPQAVHGDLRVGRTHLGHAGTRPDRGVGVQVGGGAAGGRLVADPKFPDRGRRGVKRAASDGSSAAQSRCQRGAGRGTVRAGSLAVCRVLRQRAPRSPIASADGGRLGAGG